MLIVTLSSVPPRFGALGPTLESLLAQTRKPDRILLYIPTKYRRFPDWDGTLPAVPEGVEIVRTDLDLGPSTKVLAAARDFAGQDVDLLLCDDDRFYPKDWAEIFVRARAEQPDAAICRIGRQAETMAQSEGKNRREPRAVRRWRITDWRFQLEFLWLQFKAGRNWRKVGAPHRKVYMRSGYIDIFEGCGGVLVKPDMFDKAAYDIPPVLWSVDDVWLSGMVTQKGVPIWIIANLRDPQETEADRYAALVSSVIDGADRGTANAQGVKYMQDRYGIWQ